MGLLHDNITEVLNLNDPEVRRQLRKESKLEPVARLEVLSVTFDKEEFEPIDSNPYDSDGMIMPEGYKEDTDDNGDDTNNNPIKDRDSHTDIDRDYTDDNCIKDCDNCIGGDDTSHNPIKGRDNNVDIGEDDTDNINPIKGRDNNVDIGEDDTDNINPIKGRDNNVDIGQDDTDNINPIKGRDNNVDIGQDDTDNINPIKGRDNNVDIGQDDTDNNPYFRIYISDGAHVQEIYDPAKVDKLLCTTPLPSYGNQNIPKRARGIYSISGHQADLPLIGQNEEQEYQDSGRCGSPLPKYNTGLSLTSSLCEEEMQFSGSSQDLKQKLSHVISQPTVLPLTGPNGDIVPFPYFDVIVRKDSKHIDESHRDWIRVNNSCVIPSDVVSSWKANHFGYYNHRIELKAYCPFGALTLDCIVFDNSRLVTVGIKWLVEGSGENGKKKHAATETYICGKLEFYNSEFKDMKSVLLETPEDKAVMVKGDDSVPLLRSVVAVPECSSFTVDVNLRDAITNSGIDSPVAFEVDFSKRGIFEKSKEVCFAGGKIVVEVTMKTNDNINYLLFGDLSDK